jgi:hypothetical protein
VESEPHHSTGSAWGGTRSLVGDPDVGTLIDASALSGTDGTALPPQFDDCVRGVMQGLELRDQQLQVGRAMIRCVQAGAPKQVLEIADIAALPEGSGGATARVVTLLNPSQTQESAEIRGRSAIYGPGNPS